jgi:DNA segregation ATPase FtsK/SpoIIIE-like protein
MDKTISHINELCKQDIDVIQDEYSLEIPIGKNLSGEIFYFTFGKNTNAHSAIIGGTPGSGKTNLMNCIIANGMKMYSPQELKFVILDCNAVEFQDYKNSVHLEKLCLTSIPEEGIKIVEEVEKERQNRAVLFQENGVSNIVEYVQKTGKALPRLIFVIDEFQILFQAKRSTDVNNVDTNLVNIIKLGRKFGIHLILCTQSLGEGVRRSILDNIKLRIALNMTSTQSASFLDNNNTDAENVNKGSAIYNNDKGRKNANQFVRIDLMGKQQIAEILKLNQEKYGK